MLETILYFALGFLSALLIALMISPAIWNRAVLLTRKRIESSVPLTLNEIQADKDQLRAEFAMSTRRLEMSVEELRDKASRQVIEIGRKRDELARLAEESREKIKKIEELENRGSELRARLREREQMLAEANRRLEEMSSQLEERALELEQVRGDLTRAQAQADSSRIELVAKQTAMENLTDQYSDIEQREHGLSDELTRLRAEAETAQKTLEREKKKRSELQSEMAALRRQIDEGEQALEKSQSNVARLRETTDVEDRTNAELTAQLMAEKSRTVELEAQLAQSALQMEALLNDASNDNVSKAMDSLNRDKEALEKRLAEITEERDRLKQDLSGRSREESRDWEEERRENAILRERINDMAAQVTAMTAALEGDNSAIDRILDELPKPVARDGKASKADLADDEAAAVQPTLAERIRALRDQARRDKAS